MADRAVSSLDRERVQRVLRATLYEGYALYPYRADALKNRRRFMFGTLHPAVAGSAEPTMATTECLVRGDARTGLESRVRGLQPIERLADDGVWDEVAEREIALPARPLGALAQEPESTSVEWPGGEETEGGVVRRRHRVHVQVTRRAAVLGDGLFRVSVSVHNVTTLPAHGRPEDARLAVLASVHTLLGVAGGRFVSLLDPPAEVREAAAACANIGTWPVLVGEPGEDDAMLSAPIILYDHPAVAPESAGASSTDTSMPAPAMPSVRPRAAPMRACATCSIARRRWTPRASRACTAGIACLGSSRKVVGTVATARRRARCARVSVCGSGHGGAPTCSTWRSRGARR